MEKQKKDRCPNAIGAFSGIPVNSDKIVFGALKCNSWHCEVCNGRLVKKLYKRILQGAIGEDATSKYGFKFLTLTYGGQKEREKAKQSLQEYNKKAAKRLELKEYIYNEMIKNFHKLIRALKKRYGNFHYFRVCELHKDGVPHIHVLLAGNAIIPKGILNSIEKLWRGKYGMGFVKINCVKFRNKKHAVRYMLKYITKDIQQVGRWKRIFSASRNSLTKIVKTDWLIVKMKIGTVSDKGIQEIEFDKSFLEQYDESSLDNLLWKLLPKVKNIFDLPRHGYQLVKNY